MAYKSVYPVAQSDDYVKATTKLGVQYWAYFTTDPTKSLTGTYTGSQWLAEDFSSRFHIDLGSAKVVKRIYYENSHSSGTATLSGARNFTFWGSNTAGSFAELTYTTDTGWTQITPAQSTFDQHVAVDQADPKYITVTNTTAYRYYAFKFADSWGGGANYPGVRRIELQIIPPSGGFFLFINN